MNMDIAKNQRGEVCVWCHGSWQPIRVAAGRLFCFRCRRDVTAVFGAEFRRALLGPKAA